MRIRTVPSSSPWLLSLSFASGLALVACSGVADAPESTAPVGDEVSRPVVEEARAPEPFEDAPNSDAASALSSAGPVPARVAWGKLTNPIVAYPDRAVKDMTVRYVDGIWHMFFSYIREAPFRFQIGHITSRDLVRWSRVEVWDDPQTKGLASPEITLLPSGEYVITYNSHTEDVGGARPKLYYRTTRDFVTYSAPKRLLSNLYTGRGDRLIDAALAATADGYFVAFKEEQRFRIAYRALGSLDGGFRELDRPSPRIENYQFLQIDGKWRLLGTALEGGHRPLLFTLRGDASRRENWSRWDAETELSVPGESWNTRERANSAHLVDHRAVDGFYYLFYAGSTELSRYEGRGHAKIGIARSRDLVRWQVP
jgi:hypothetical protein